MKSLELIRKIALHYQMLANNELDKKNNNRVFKIINQLGYIQIDTISVVQRAHHHTLWSRYLDYTPVLLDQLLAQDRLIFEYWAHAASYIPLQDYRFYMPLMKRHCDSQSQWIKEWMSANHHWLDIVRKRIREEGSLASKNFINPDTPRQRGWWSWKSAKMALEILLWRGELMISRRVKFQRFYDLTERILPSWVDVRYPDGEELSEFFTSRALNALGCASEKDVQNYIPVVPKMILSAKFKQMAEDQRIVPLPPINNVRTIYYTLPEFLELHHFEKDETACHILSPFDNMIILRDRIKNIFGFDYSIECYLPAGKRKYGYFSLPVFSEDKFTGRLDAKTNRKLSIFHINRFVFESGFTPSDQFWERFSQKLKSFIQFNECNSIEIADIHPVKYRKQFKNMVNQMSLPAHR